MTQSVTVFQSYEAARETCARLYIAAGRSARDTWTVQPFPGTAAISGRSRRTYYPWGMVTEWTLGMPAMPLHARLTRREADLMAAYVVHELGHALFTDFDVVRQAYGLGLARLLNAIEDARIERLLADLTAAPEARRLLVWLSDHIVSRDAAKWKLDNPKSFAYTLNVILMCEGLGYPCDAFPADWRARMPAAWVAIVERVLREEPRLNSTAEALTLAQWVQAAMAGAQGAQQGQQQQQQQQQGQQQQGAGDDAQGQQQQQPQQQGDAGEDEASDDGAGALGAQGESDDADDTGAAPGGQAGGAGDDDDDDSDDATTDGGASADAGDKSGARGTGPGVDLTDKGQRDAEPDLGDIARDVCKRNGTTQTAQGAANRAAREFVEVAPCEIRDAPRAVDAARVARAASLVTAPAKIRRDVREAVRSPERVQWERGATQGRLDMRAMTRFETSEAVFARREETEGREAAVSLLIDMSSSMGGAPSDAACALALHLGDALKLANVRFEIAGFGQHGRDDGRPSAALYVAKPFAMPWDEGARGRAVSVGQRYHGGTNMMPGIHEMAGRLARVAHVTRRVLLVLTDGQDGFRVEANRACIAHWAAKGVETIGLGLLHDASDVFDRHVYVPNAGALATAGLRELVAVLNPARRRAA